MKRVLLLTLFLSAVVASAAQAVPQQWWYHIDQAGNRAELHWAVTKEPFQVNPGYNDGGSAATCIDRALAAWDQTASIEGSNRVQLGSSEQDYPVIILQSAGYAGLASASFNQHGAFLASTGTDPATQPRVELRADYATNQHVCSHEIGHMFGHDHASDLYGDCNAVMSYCNFTTLYPNAAEIAFVDSTIQDHLDGYTSLNGPQNDVPLQGDADGDGVDDSQDLCLGTPSGTSVDPYGCPWGTVPPTPTPTPTPEPTPEPTPVPTPTPTPTPEPQPPKPCRPHKWKPCPVLRDGNTFMYAKRHGVYVSVHVEPLPGKALKINPKTGLPVGVRR